MKKYKISFILETDIEDLSNIRRDFVELLQQYYIGSFHEDTKSITVEKL